MLEVTFSYVNSYVKYCLKQKITSRKQPYSGTKDKGIWGKMRTLARSQRGSKPTFKHTHAPDGWTEEVDLAWKREKTPRSILHEVKSPAGKPH